MIKMIKREEIPKNCDKCGEKLKSYHQAGGITRMVCSAKCDGYGIVVVIDHKAESRGDTDAILLYP